MTKRIGFFAYGVMAYGIFFASFLYAIGFIGNIAVPKAIDSVPEQPLLVALAVDLLLLGVFAIQHSVMARPGFKLWWTRVIPKELERNTYVLISSLLLIALFVFWQPLGGVVWQMENPIAQIVMYALMAFGWLLVLVSTFLINHFDLFGLRQAWFNLTGREYTPLAFKTPSLYKYVRHPLYLGWFFAFWATPTMTVTHLLFAVCTTIYILIAIQLEEKDLEDFHPEYKAYRKHVPMIIPRFGKKLGNQKLDPETAPANA